MFFISMLITLSSSAVNYRRDKSILYSRISIIILISTLILSLNSFYINLYEKGLGLFSGLLQTTAVVHSFHIFVILISAVILLLNSFYSRKISLENHNGFLKPLVLNIKYYNSFILNKMGEQYRIAEYPLIILFVIMGGVLLMSSNDLITVFLSIELQSYGLYILCVIYRDSEKSTSGGLTYFLLGGLSSCFILLASALIYGNSGNSSFDGLLVINNIFNINISTEDSVNLSSNYSTNYLNISLMIMSIGFLFKISAAPFHFWSPDVYDAIPTIVTTFVSTFAKISILILLLILINYTNASLIENISQDNYKWTITLLTSSLISLIIGAVLGLTQHRIKRLFAYSTISHLGFILLALSVNSTESIEAFIFYIMQYSITNINAFIILIAIGYSLYIYKNKNVEIYSEINNSPVQLVSQLKGYFYINPYIAISLAITLFSFVGIPPLLGFFAKQMVISSAIDKGYIFMVLIAILTSAISAYYYLNMVKTMYFNKTDYILNNNLDKNSIELHIINKKENKNIEINTSNIHLSGSLSITISILTLIILLFMLTPQEWLNISTILALTLNN